MDRLRDVFGSSGLRGVVTYIASGNVMFDGTGSATAQAPLEAKIAKVLRAELGYEVATFVRTAAEMRTAADEIPFRATEISDFEALSVAFVAAPLSSANKKALAGLTTDVDEFAVRGREIYWGCRVKQSDSKFSNAVLERKVGITATLRSIKTVRALADRMARSIEL